LVFQFVIWAVSPHAFRSPNLKSVFEHPDEVNSKLQKEILAGRIVGPLDKPPFKSFRISPLGIVPKRAPGEFHLIHHLSYPSGFSVNDGIPKELASVHYATIDDAVKLIMSLGKGSFLAKTDIKSAFRIIPLTPCDFDLLGIEWQGKYYFDRCLRMGCSSSCNDFLFIAPSKIKCQNDLDNFLAICDHIGVPIAEEKTMGPGTTLQFAGITLDTVKMQARLPEDKLERCHAKL